MIQYSPYGRSGDRPHNPDEEVKITSSSGGLGGL